MALADRLGGDFLDADPYHPTANVEKMSRGIPLTDEDRASWLDILAGMLRGRLGSGRPVMLACSALKESYRQRLRVSPDVRFVHLKGTYQVLLRRMEERQGHFMKASMLKSQFETLEDPATGPGTDGLAVDVELSVEQIVDRVIAAWPPNRAGVNS